MKTPLTPDDEALLTQWLDGAVPAAARDQLALLLQQHPELQSLPHEWKAVATALRGELPQTLEPASPDFFVSQILGQIEPPKQKFTAPARPLFSWWQVLKSGWIAPLAATAAVVAAGLFLKTRATKLEIAAGPYSPDPTVKASLAFNEEANATVLDLENLKMEDGVEIRPFSVASNDDPAMPGLPQTFYAANSGKVLFTLGTRTGSPDILIR
jgi:negative regulator of sigma E activity